MAEKTNNNASISEYIISPLSTPNKGVVAVASATFFNTIIVNSITICQGKYGLYVRMPQKKTNQGNYIDVAHPLSPEGRRNINNTLISGFEQGKLRQSFAVKTPTVEAQNSVKNPDGKNTLARLDLIVGDFVVHNAKITVTNDVKRLNMPTYKSSTGKITSICIPADKEAYAKLNQAALKEFNTEYSYQKVDDNALAGIKESGIPVQARKSGADENIIKFKTADLQKINAVLSGNPIQSFKH